MSDCSPQGDGKPYLETEKSVELVGVEYDDLKGFCVAAKKDLKTLGNRLDSFCTE